MSEIQYSPLCREQQQQQQQQQPDHTSTEALTPAAADDVTAAPLAEGDDLGFDEVAAPRTKARLFLQCPHCEKVLDSSATLLRNKRGWVQINCRKTEAGCARKTSSLHWKCTCGIPWFQCPMHAPDERHANDLKPQRAKTSRPIAALRNAPAPMLQVQPRAITHKPKNVYEPAMNLGAPPSDSSHLREVRPLQSSLCPKLFAKFPSKFG